MKLTNIYNLPQPVVDAVTNDPYNKGEADYSITGLLQPPQKTALFTRYNDEITEDVSDRVASLIGQVAHGILERAEREAWAERRFFTVWAGKRISGSVDRMLYYKGELSDYKTCKAWKAKLALEGDIAEWTAQVNGYIALLHDNGIEVKTARVIPIILDWAKRQAHRDDKYPPHPLLSIPIEIWPRDKTIAYFSTRIALHEGVKGMNTEDIHIAYPCSEKDRWKRPDQYAVKKKGTARAIKIYDNIIQAQEHVNLGGEEYSLEHRVSESIRCEDFCSSQPFCKQYQQAKNGNR